MSTFAKWNDVLVCNKDGFSIVLSFSPETIPMKTHFIKECGWSERDYDTIKDYYWFVATVSAYKDGKVCGQAQLKGNCFKSLKEVKSTSVEKMLGGFMPQLIDDAIFNATTDLTTPNGSI